MSLRITKRLLFGTLLLLSAISVSAQPDKAVAEQAILFHPKTHFSFSELVNPFYHLEKKEENYPRYLSIHTFSSTAAIDQTDLQAYQYNELAFFCRLEVRLEKVTKMPVRFRLGDVQQVDYLEGKFSGWRYGY